MIPRLGCALALTMCALVTLAAENVSFTADSVESVLAKGKEHTVLQGRAKVSVGKLAISADRIELSGKDNNILQCDGNVIIIDSDKGMRIESPSVYYDRSRKLTRAQGPSTIEDRENKLVLKAEWIENDGQTEVMVAQIAVRILKEDLACRSEYAVYRRKDNSLELTGAPMARKGSDEYRATRIFVNTKTEEIKLEGQVSGVVAGGTGPGGGSADATATPPLDANIPKDQPATPAPGSGATP